MAFELIHTSVPKGLRPGSQGYCTVAYTKGMPANYVELGEELSQYAAYYRVTDPKYLLSPVAYSYCRALLGGSEMAVLSRTTCHSPDYSGRTNYLAHHWLLDLGDDDAAPPAGAWPPPAGPAALMQDRDARPFLTAWHGEPHLLEPRGRLPAVPSASGLARTWEAVTGSAGWAGVLAQHSLQPDAPPACMVYDPEQLPDPEALLRLVVEAMALLPPAQRWQVTFHTYFQRLSARSSCAWRFCVARNAAAIRSAQRTPGHLLLDLTQPLGQPPDGELVACALEGRLPRWATPAGAGSVGAGSGRALALRGLGAAPGVSVDDRIPLRPSLSVAPPPRVVTVGAGSGPPPPERDALDGSWSTGRTLAWASVIGLVLLLAVLAWWHGQAKAVDTAVRRAGSPPAPAAVVAPAEHAPAGAGTGPPPPADLAPAADPGQEAAPEPNTPDPAGQQLAALAVTPPAAPRRVIVLPEPFSRTGISLQEARRRGLPLDDEQSLWDCDVALLVRGTRVEPALREVRQDNHPSGAVGEQDCRVSVPGSPYGVRLFRDALGFPKVDQPIDAVILARRGYWQAVLLLDPLRVTGRPPFGTLDLADGWRLTDGLAAGTGNAQLGQYAVQADPEIVVELGEGLTAYGFDGPQIEAIVERVCSAEMSWTLRLELGPGDVALALGLGGRTAAAAVCTVPVAVDWQQTASPRLVLRLQRGVRLATPAGVPPGLTAEGLEKALAEGANGLLTDCRKVLPEQVLRALRQAAGADDPGLAALDGIALRISDLRWRLGGAPPDSARLEQKRATCAQARKRLAAAVPARAGADPGRDVDQGLATLCANLSQAEIERLRSGPLQAAVDAALAFREDLAGVRRRLSGKGQEEALRQAEKQKQDGFSKVLDDLRDSRILSGGRLADDGASALAGQLREVALAVAVDSPGQVAALRRYLDAAAESEQLEQAHRQQEELDAAVKRWNAALPGVLLPWLKQGAWYRAVILDLTVGSAGERPDGRPFLKVVPGGGGAR